MFNEALAVTFRAPSRQQDPFMKSENVIPLRKIYEEEQTRSLSERQKMIAKLKEQVQSGTYKPNLEIVAERMLLDACVPDVGKK